MKFAFLIMDGHFSGERAAIEGGNAVIVGVRSPEEAEHAARALQREGVGCIELCGAFGEEGARRVIAATQNRIPVGYVTHIAEQEEVYRRAFGKTP